MNQTAYFCEPCLENGIIKAIEAWYTKIQSVCDPDTTSLTLYDLQIKAGDVESWILTENHVQ